MNLRFLEQLCLNEHPGKILSLFEDSFFLVLSQMLFTQATIDRLTTNKTNNAFHNETVILNYISGDPIGHSLSKKHFVNVL